MARTQNGLKNMAPLHRVWAAFDELSQVQAKLSYRQLRGDDYAVSATLNGKSRRWSAGSSKYSRTRQSKTPGGSPPGALSDRDQTTGVRSCAERAAGRSRCSDPSARIVQPAYRQRQTEQLLYLCS